MLTENITVHGLINEKISYLYMAFQSKNTARLKWFIYLYSANHDCSRRQFLRHLSLFSLKNEV